MIKNLLRKAVGKPPAGRTWFQDADGTFYRNIPLNLSDRTRALHRCDFVLLDALQEEWGELFSAGIRRVSELSRGDYVVEPLPFRVAYPEAQYAPLWRFDEEDDR